MHQSYKQFRSIATKGAGDPSAQQLIAINMIALRELKTEEVYVRTAILAHNAIDRDNEAFDEKLLFDFARTLPGKGLFVKHPRSFDGDSGPGVGRWFEAKVVKMPLAEARELLREPNLKFPPGVSEAQLVEASYFVPRSEKNKDLIIDIDSGIAGDLSIGFSAAKRSPILDDDGHEIASRLEAPGEGLEGSLVWLGAQPGARSIKSANKNNPDEVLNMKTLEELQKEVEAQNKTNGQLVEQNKTLTAKAAQFDALAEHKSVGMDLASNPEALAAAIDLGKTYHGSIIDDIISAKRLMGMVGDTDDDQKAAKAIYAGASTEALKSERAGLIKQLPAGTQLAGGDPNKGAPTPAQVAESDADFKNPVMNPATKVAA